MEHLGGLPAWLSSCEEGEACDLGLSWLGRAGMKGTGRELVLRIGGQRVKAGKGLCDFLSQNGVKGFLQLCLGCNWVRLV